MPPPWYKGGVGGTPSGVFDMLQHFETISPSVESLWSSLQDEEYLMGGAAGGLWRHQAWSPSWLPSWILSKIRNKVKTVRINHFWRLTYVKQHIHNFFASFLPASSASVTFLVEKSWKNVHFHPKMYWPPATYDVIYRNHSNWPSLNLSQNVREW